MTTNLSNKIIACDSLGGGDVPLNLQQMCAILGGTFNPAAVLPAPKCQLPVVSAQPVFQQISFINNINGNTAQVPCPPGFKIIPGSETATNFPKGTDTTTNSMWCNNNGGCGAFGGLAACATCKAMCYK